MRVLTFLAKRFVAGESIEKAVEAIKALNADNIEATIDFLGENVHTEEEARAAADEYLVILDEIRKNGIKSNVSIKLTMMGLEIDPEFCYENVKRIVKKAAELDNFVRIDMEGSPVTQVTLDVFNRLYEEFKNVGIVIQAYLYRSEEDIRVLAARGVNVRLCKGAYKEPPDVAFPRKEDVNDNYVKLGKILLDGKGKAAIATHDRHMIDALSAHISENDIPKTRYEYQMLYGIERELQKKLAAAGEPVRVYVPYGDDWLGYFSRRMIERKENFLFALKHFFKA